MASQFITQSSQFTTRWDIKYSNGSTLVVYRKRKPTRLAASLAKGQRANGTTQNAYTINRRGLVNVEAKKTQSLQQTFEVIQQYDSINDLRMNWQLHEPRLLGHYPAATVGEAIRWATQEHKIPAVLLQAELITVPV